MSKTIIPVKVFDMVVFGAHGDLAMRKLFPALYRRYADNQIPKESRIIGLSLTNLSSDEFRKKVFQTLKKHISEEDFNIDKIDSFLSQIQYHSNDVNDPDSWEHLQRLLADENERIRVYYLSVAPSLFSTIAEGLASVDLNSNGERLVVEKPFGHDKESAEELNNKLGRYFPERCIYRIDHYLGKETVQNLMAFRFANALFEPQWNTHAIDHVQITVSETLGVGTRSEYYDSTGAMRDMVQNHLIQLLCLIAMEPPYAFEADALRDEKIKVLKSLRPLKNHDALQNTRRGQYLYSPSALGYKEEVGNLNSKCETYVALKVEIDNWRWSGVPFFLRTGKRL